VLAAGVRARVLAGGPERVAAGLRAIAAAAAADELMITTAVHDHDERKRSYERIARAMAPGERTEA
jgi:alkanesulfonate monooxygenase SsuD/methylene tetrahydromethanopterin reductase-like flavin-dependent oxidoreductase (luciferase family)